MTNKIKLFFILAILGLALGKAIYVQGATLSQEISEIICSIEEPCSEELECVSFPEIGLRCAQPNPCSYYECPEDTQCFVAESYPLQVICSPLVGAEEPEDTETVEQAINLDEDIQPADLEVSPPTVLPDNPFYFFKNLGRNIRSLFTFNPVAKAELREKFANEKLIELKEMIQRKKSAQAIKRAAENYEGEIETVKRLTERIRENAQENEEVGKFLDKYTQHQILHQRLLQKLEEQVPPEVLDKIKESREKHLIGFKDVMLKLEDKDKIPERLEENLEKITGSKFKEFRNIEILDNLKEKLPQDIKEKIEEKKENMLENLRGKLENLSQEQQERFKEYIEKISGNKIKQLDILNALGGKELSGKLRSVVEQAKERNIERIENQYQNIATKEKVEAKIKEAEELFEKVKSLIVEKNATAEEIPAVFRLVEEAEEKLVLAKQELEGQNYTKAYGQAIASLSLSRNAIRIMEVRAGFQQGDGTGTITCAAIKSPVCEKNGKTYLNICEAKKVNAEIAYRGECKTNIVCAKEDEEINRNPLLGTVSRICCEGLEEVRVNRTYNICKNPGVSFECTTDKDCPLPRCPGLTSRCVEGTCIVPRCENPRVCIHVITPAKNPRTDECRNFPTPCDVPSDWEKTTACGIQQEIREQIQLKANQ